MNFDLEEIKTLKRTVMSYSVKHGFANRYLNLLELKLSAIQENLEAKLSLEEQSVQRFNDVRLETL